MSRKKPTPLELLTVEQVAAVLQVSERTVTRAIASRGLRAAQVAGRGTWRVRREDLDAWLESRSNTPAGPAVAPAPVCGRETKARYPAVVARRRGGTGHLTLEPGMGR